EILGNPANDFVRNFIGVERIQRQRPFGDKNLSEFVNLFNEDGPDDIQEVSGTISVKEAFEVLEKSGQSHLAIRVGQNRRVYASERELLKAALLKEEGELV